MRYLHQVIVDDIGQMIRRQRVGRLVEHFVVQRRRVDRHVAPDQVVHMHLLVFGHHEAYDPRFAGFHSPAHFLGRQRERRGQPAPYLVVIGERLAPRFGLGPDRGELLLRVERIVGVTRFDELLCVFQIDFAALALPIRGVRSSFGDPLVDAYPAPCERVEDIFLRSRHEPLRIGVFDAEDEVSAVLAGEQVVVQRRTDAAHVQRARRTGRESYSDFSFHVSSFPFIS